MIVERYELHEDPVPVQYLVLRVEGRPEVVIDRVRQEDGSHKWAIRDGRCCLSKKGEWDYESMPSNRPDDWIETHRFDTLEEAAKTARGAAEQRLADYKERVRLCNEQEARKSAT